MQAIQVENYGGADKLQIKQIDKPSVQPNQVLIKVHAASLNPFDTNLREGRFKDSIPLNLPFVPGGDLAGIIVEKGSGVTDFNVGDKVYGQAAVVAGNSGAFAEYAATKAGQVALMPKNLNYEEAASLPLVGVSALQALQDHLQLQAGQKVFIHGGTGGIGSIAIQIAKHFGATVAASSYGPADDYLKELGADIIVDSKSEDFAEKLHGYDAVFDTVGGDDFDKALTILKPGGKAVSMIAVADAKKAAELQIGAITQSTKVDTQKLNKLTELVENKILKPHVSKVFQLSDAQRAFRERENRNVKGKIVLRIN